MHVTEESEEGEEDIYTANSDDKETILTVNDHPPL